MPNGQRARWEAVEASVRERWPELELDRVNHFLAELATAPAASEAGERQRDLGGLYLAYVCRGQRPGAMRALHRELVKITNQVARKLDLGSAGAEDLLQEVEQKLLVSEGGSAPKLAEFLGEGSLLGWLRAVVTRTALNLKRGSSSREVPDEDHLLDRVTAAKENPELAYLRQRYAKALKVAFAHAWGELESRDRLMLRQRYVDGLSNNEIAAAHRIHPVTCSKWLSRSRKLLSDRTHALLCDSLKLSPSDVRSVERLVHSQLDLSIAGILAARTKAPS